MSVQAMSWVFEHSEATLGSRLILLAIAGHADREGRNSWASVGSLAEEARLSERQARYALRNLEELGEIRNTGLRGVRADRRTRVYELPKMGADIAPREGVRGAILDANGGQPIAPEPKAEPSKTLAATRRDELFEAVAEVCSVDRTSLTPSARGELNRAVKELRGVGATPDDTRSRAARYRVKFPGADLTPSALAKHWPKLGGGNGSGVVREVRPYDHVDWDQVAR